MHEYYAKNKAKLKKDMNKMLSLISGELEEASGKKYKEIIEEIWTYYENELLDKFPYIGGDKASGTRNLTGAYCFVAMGEVLKKYGSGIDEIGKLMVLSYERLAYKMSPIVRKIFRKLAKNTKLLNKMFLKRDAKNEKNISKYPDSFKTKTKIPPEEGYDFSFHNIACPLANFAKQYGYEEYMPYLCNLDYVMLGVMEIPLFREHTCFEDGDYCDFKIKNDAKPLPYWPPVFRQGKGYK